MSREARSPRGIAFCYFASLCSGSLTHPPSAAPFGFSSSSLSLSLSPVRRSAKVGRLLAFGRQQSSKDASSVVTAKIRGERCSRLSLVAETPSWTRSNEDGAKRALPKGYSPSDNPFLERFLSSLYRSLPFPSDISRDPSLCKWKERKFESHWSPRGLRHCPPVGPF